MKAQQIYSKMNPQKSKSILDANKNPIAIIHHGEDERDVEKEVGGTQPTNLTADGKEGAISAADKLKKQGVQKVFTSPVKRAMQTAAKIQLKGIPTEINNSLGAWKIGNFDGMPREDFHKAEKYFVNNPDAKTFPEMKNYQLKESFNEFKNRVVGGYNKIVSDNNASQDKVGILTHSKNIKVLKSTDNNNGWNPKSKAEFLDPENKIKNAEVKTKQPTSTIKNYLNKR